jgi:hypothetical protein
MLLLLLLHGFMHCGEVFILKNRQRYRKQTDLRAE